MKNRLAILSAKVRVSMIISAAVLVSTLSMNSQAPTIQLGGPITGATGAFQGVVGFPPRPPWSGFIEYDDVAVAAGLAGPNDILELQMHIGVLCFFLNVRDCAGGTSLAQLDTINSAAVTFAGGNPTGGTWVATFSGSALSLTFPIVFDVNTRTWSIDGGVFGTVAGRDDSQLLATPVPAAAGYSVQPCWA